MKRVLIAAGIGIGLTVVAVVVAGMGGGACHCSTPVRVIFPFEELFGRGGEGTLDLLLVVLQFPVYAVTMAFASLRPNGGVWTAVSLLALLGAHFVAALFASQIPG